MTLYRSFGASTPTSKWRGDYMPRYLFVLPDVERPTGGVNVVLQMVEILCENGFQAAIVNAGGSYHYPFFETSHRPYFYTDLAKIPVSFMGRRERLQTYLRKKFAQSSKSAEFNRALEIKPDDVFVIPEFWYPEYSAIFPRNRRVLLAQDVFGFCYALNREKRSGTQFIDSFDAVIATSEASRKAVSKFTNRKSLLVSQSVIRPTLDSTAIKQRQIAYMPRKRPEEIETLLGCINGNKAFDGWVFQEIKNVESEKLDKIISSSLIFLSFSYKEGFGLPPAEAMAAGCIVVGYTGVGGEEYFGTNTGLPIADGDIVAFADTLIDVVTEYDSDPTRLDTLRHGAAKYISERYNSETMKKTLLSAWREIDDKCS